MTTQKKKLKTAYFCRECGAEHARWQGQCRECSEWNSLIEEQLPTAKGKPVRPTTRQSQQLKDLSTETAAGFKSGIDELDRVLGGQLLPGMTVLLGGDPGIGKSTLTLQAADAYAKQGMTVLYVSAEESLTQLKIRANRLGISGDGIAVANATSLEEIIALMESDHPTVVVIDSIQTIASDLFDSPPGTVAQVRESAARLITHSKQHDTALFLVGHVTKEGMVAGPKVLEHMVDTVVYFEGDPTQLYRILRANKNRYGSVAEIGVFEMMSSGLVEVDNPSSLFLSERSDGHKTGSVVSAICEGNRPILVELQALVAPANYGNPQRVAGGFDNRRLSLLLAILEKRCGYPVSQHDVFVSIAGGLKVAEPALDLPIMVAIVSSLLDKAVPPSVVVAGEAGLSGEVRGVTLADRRVAEAKRMGFEMVIIPKTNAARLPESGINVHGAESIMQVMDELLA